MGYPQSGAPTAGELPLSGSSLLKWLPVCLLLSSFSLCVGLSLRCLLPFSLALGPFELWGSPRGCGAECVGKGLVRGEGSGGSG